MGDFYGYFEGGVDEILTRHTNKYNVYRIKQILINKFLYHMIPGVQYFYIYYIKHTIHIFRIL